MQIEWEENETGTEASATVGALRMLVSLYTEDFPCRGMWHYQTFVQDTPLAAVSGVVRTRDEAISHALGWAEKGVDAVRAAAVRELQDKLYVTMMEIAEIDPIAPMQYPHFEAGFNAGLAAARGALDSLWTVQFGHDIHDGSTRHTWPQSPQFLEDEGVAGGELPKH